MASQPHKATSPARNYKPLLKDRSSRAARPVKIRSFLTLGNLYELIAVEDETTKDDAYIQGVREEIEGEPPFHGRYARKMGLLHIVTRRVSHESNDILYRHTNPKREKGAVVLNSMGKPKFFPRQYIVRMVSDEERAMEKEEWTKYRKRLLNTIASILHAYEEKQRKLKEEEENKGKKKRKEEKTRPYSTTTYTVPDPGWDLTPPEELLRPLDWYITDQYVESIIQGVYVEEEIGRWDMFSENVLEAGCYFSEPYSYLAEQYGFRNPGESSVREPCRPAPKAVQQAYDTGDILPLEEEGNG